MILCKVSELREGMVIAQDVVVSGVALPVLKRGVVLNEQYIDSIKKYGINFLYIEPPEDYSGAKGETLLLTEIKNNVVFQGRVEIKSSVPPNMVIEAGESIIIHGNVAEGCRLVSKYGAIIMKGSVKAIEGNPSHLQAKQRVKAISMNHAVIKTDGEFVIDGDIIDTNVSAKGEVVISGKVIRSQVNTGLRAVVGECGNKESEAVSLVVNPIEAQEIMQNALKIDSQISELSKEKAQLQNIIDLIKKLGSNVEQLPQEKKLELAKGAKRFTEISGQIQNLTAKKNELLENLKQILAVRRIIVNGEIYPNVKIQISGKSVAITKSEKRVAFCVEEGKISMKIL